MLIVSLNYSPVYSAHMYALYCAATDLGISIKIFCHFRYCADLIAKGVENSSIISYSSRSNNFLSEFIKKDWRRVLKVIAEQDSMSCLVMNPHPANPIFLADYGKIVGGKRFLWLHEPHKTFLELSHFGVRKGIYIFIAMVISQWSVRNIEHCLLPSKYALNIFKKYYHQMADKCGLLPLMFPMVNTEVKERTYFSYVGHIAKEKGIIPFLELVEYCLNHEMQFQFQIISSNLYDPLLSRAKRCEGINLKIIAKNYITDREIAESIASSYAILCLCLNTTQSSVVANAMMQGTPVIASRSGSLPDVIVDGKTGYFVEDVYDHASNIKLLELCIVKDNFYKKYCLEEFHKSYSIDALKPDLLQLINMDI